MYNSKEFTQQFSFILFQGAFIGLALKIFKFGNWKVSQFLPNIFFVCFLFGQYSKCHSCVRVNVIRNTVGMENDGGGGGGEGANYLVALQ